MPKDELPLSFMTRLQVMLKALGAKVVLTPAAKGMGGAVKKAEEIVASLGKNGYLLQQFNNPDNPKIHRLALPPSTWHACPSERHGKSTHP